MNTKTFNPVKDKVFVTDLEHGIQRSAGGIILPEDNMAMHGIRNRWAKVYKVGPEITDLKYGDWVLIKHGRWTNRIKVEDNGEEILMWRAEYPDGILVVSEDDPRARKEIATPTLSGYGSGD